MSQRRWWQERRTVVGAVVLAVVAIVVAVAIGHRSGTSDAAGPGATGAGVTAPTGSPTSDGAGGAAGTMTSSGSGSGSGAAGPSGTRTVSPYCQRYQQILAGDGETAQQEGDSVDLDELSATFARLIARYSEAAALAPPELKEPYATALARLRDMKQAVDDRDLDRIKAMTSELATLNTTMDRIQQVSRDVCG